MCEGERSVRSEEDRMGGEMGEGEIEEVSRERSG